MSDDPFLSRWSRLKRQAKEAPNRSAAPAVPAEPELPSSPTQAAGSAAAPSEPKPLPPLESLTPESDFTPFMQAEVDPATRRHALKTLFQDPRFNVMDGLDTYIADYSIADPLPEGWLEKMHQFSRLGDFAAREAERLAAAAQSAPIPEKQAGSAHPSEASDVQIPEAAEAPVSPDPIEGMPTRTG